MHVLHQRAEQMEIVVRGIAESRTISGRVHVRNVRADGEMDGHRNAVFVRGNEDARVRVFDSNNAARKILSRRFADRKSTRLNSSHANISYAVFCLKKKNTIQSDTICAHAQ